VSNAVVNIQDSKGLPKAELMASGGTVLLLIVFGGLVGGIIWNLFTWLLGLPSSSSHALLGGLVGGTIGALGFAGVKWAGDGSQARRRHRQGDPAVPASHPVIAMIVAATATRLIFIITAAGRGQVPRAPLPLGPGRAPPRSSPSRTAPTTPRRRWASSRLALVAAAVRRVPPERLRSRSG
jgi:uncharacterized membrane protein YidH (DUF202 family)